MIEYDDNEEIREIIKSLPNGKALGFAEVTNEMIKYACIEKITIIISEIIREMLKYGKIPYFFNVGEIMPIIKNEKESKTDMSNNRLITISDPLANIFEKNVEQHIETRHKDPEVQFGF